MLNNPYVVGASWLLVLILTAVNIFVFLKLKKFGDQMLKSAFPGAKNSADALKNMQKMMAGMGGALGGQGKGPGGNPGNLSGLGGMNPADLQAQMRMAMGMLSKLQQNTPPSNPFGKPGSKK